MLAALVLLEGAELVLLGLLLGRLGLLAWGPPAKERTRPAVTEEDREEVPAGTVDLTEGLVNLMTYTAGGDRKEEET